MRRLALVMLLLLGASSALAQKSDPRDNGTGAPGAVSRSPGGPAPSEHFAGSVLVGEHAPDFSLVAAGGKAFRLKTSRGRWTALFFTDRREDLPRLVGLAATLDTLQFNTVVVINEKVQSLTQWRNASSSSLTALADEGGEIAAMYGVWDSEHSLTRNGLFVLDPDGVVRLELLGQKVGAPSLRGLVQSAVDGI